MRTFSQKQIQPQNPVSSSLARSNMATPGLAHREDPILHLQHTIGNQAAQRMSLTNAEELKPGLTGTALPRFGYDFSRIPIRPPAAGAIQTKPAINEPGDEYEQEADRVAERVMNIAVPPLTHHSMQQQPAQTEPSLQRVDQCDGFKASRRLERLPGGSQGGGSPLPDQVRIFMEPRFGFDFSQVRIHADGQAAASAEAIQARAYTAGSEIVFGGGQYSPSSGEGTKLLAHELVHVIQNASAPQASVIRRAPAVGGVPYQIISPVWNVAGRDIVDVQIKADGRIFLMYRRTGLGFKGVGNAPPRGTWAPFDGLIPIEDLVETQGGQKAARTWPYFEKNPYYDKGESEALRGYGTETNKEVTDWLNKQKVAEG